MIPNDTKTNHSVNQLTRITYFLSACRDSTFDTSEEFVNHLVHVHKTCRKFYNCTEVQSEVAQPSPTIRTEPEVIDLDGDKEEAVNVTALVEAYAEVVEIYPQVN